MYRDVKISYGSKDGRLVHVGTVGNGLGCQCTCPACDAPLVARQGAEVAWHFAHATETSCTSAPETGLHKMAKQILMDARRIRVPIAEIQVRSGQLYTVAEPVTVEFDEIHTERAYEDIVPDLLAIVGSTPLFIEIAVTHFIDAEKMDKIRRIGISTLEINLRGTSRQIDPGRLRELLVEELPSKRWKYNAKVESARKDYEKLDREKIEEEQRKIDARREQQRRAAEEKRKVDEAEREHRRQVDEAEQKRLDEEREERRKQDQIEWERLKKEDAERQVLRAQQREVERKKEEEEDLKRRETDAVYAEKRRVQEEERAAQVQERQRREAEWSTMGSQRLQELDAIDERRQETAISKRQVQQAERDRLEGIDRTVRESHREAAYAKRRADHLALWTTADQVKYRHLRDADNMSHEEANRIIKAERAATYEQRAAEYDRLHGG